MGVIRIDNDKLEWFIKNAYKELNDRDSKYNINDLCLVRTTDILPSNGVIESRANAQAILKMYSPYFKFSDKDIELISYYSYRTTIHFTLNGLVGNHSMGSFSGRSYFIFDSLFNQVNNNLMTLRSEDTYFKDSFNLSEDASICMSEESYNHLSNDKREFLNRYKIFIYDIDKSILDNYDNERIEIGIVRYVLTSLGYPSFVISSHGYTSSCVSAILMEEFIASYACKHNISRKPHFGSDVHREDNMIESANMLESGINHYEYVVSNANIDNEFKSKMLNYLPYLRNSGLFLINKYLWAQGKSNIETKEFISDVGKFLKIVGKDEYNRLTLEYNHNLSVESENRLGNKISK